MQPLQQQNAGYDRAITVFSPDGRLFQVEYAREAVKRGTTSLGLKSKDGVVLIVDKRTVSRLVEAKSIEKIFQIDDHIGVATSGLVADARALVERARIESQINKITYNEPILVGGLAKKICDLKQLYTQNGGVRPFGSALIIGGVNGEETRLYETDPSGALIEYKATAIGSGVQAAVDVFEERYEEDLSLEDAINLGLDALYEATEGRTTEDSVEIAVIEVATQAYRKLSDEEVSGYVKDLLERNAEEEEPEEEAEEEAVEEAVEESEEAEDAAEESEEETSEEEASEDKDSAEE
ncbi:proteasome alpha subunit [Methanobrevibacter ruminantium M1]|uniref:Proteasome subunit alpha n=1 Tax=Methanobrevibacter ruminantium (strain ATCC 35063 / DSM 1093 / JCM 13430 / OCM 146 / M1) TaxID=634498 RepID=D3E3U6_METRM|nr:archaeal proteasome endopeptidase complex subunit alpha [Methanobrevibacter ruminantium]ADC47207.1 proteasome alpha subunit [Methanobrevibacter ruminantium M1]